MKTPSRASLLILPLAALLAVFLSGCKTCKPGKPGPIATYTMEVSLDQSLQQGSVLVDLVGVTAASLPRWESYSMTEYWKAGNAMRADADKVIYNFVSGKSLSSTLNATDPRWAKWRAKNVSYVLVLADLPGAQTDKPGAQDARRQMISLDLCQWGEKTKTLTVQVQKSGIDVRAALPAK